MDVRAGRIAFLAVCIVLARSMAEPRQSGAGDWGLGTRDWENETETLTPSPEPLAPNPLVVLDTLSVWRMHAQLAPPVLETGKDAALSCRWMSYETPAAATQWMKPDFDDRFWHRGPLTLVPQTAILSKACLRGKFTVTGEKGSGVIDAEDAAGRSGKGHPTPFPVLRLSATYHGGIIVYVNGKEVHREHVGQTHRLAEGPGGRERKLVDYEVPAELLKQGMNVLGLEIIRAPYPQQGAETGEDVYNVNTCAVKQVQLKAEGSGFRVQGQDPASPPATRHPPPATRPEPRTLNPEPSPAPISQAVRPEGIQVWPADPLAADMDLDYGDPAEPFQKRPVTIVGTRNGMFSGKLLVGSTKPIRGLKATVGDLVGEGSSAKGIPASAVRIRYGVEWGQQQPRELTRLNYLLPYVKYSAVQFNALAPEAPEQVTPRPLTVAWYREKNLPETVTPVPGAVVPVWITVKVPASVAAGRYTGTVKIEAQGQTPLEAPLEVRVADWKLPSTQDFRTWVDMIQCPDTLALEYNLPLWSEKHWEMIATSLKLIGETGSRTVYVPLIAHSNLGNEESMVRWIKKGDKYQYDFSTMERYLDVAEMNMGRPKLLVLVAWDVYMLPKSSLEKPHGVAFRVQPHLEHMQKIGGQYGIGPMVTVESAAADGKVTKENVVLPSHLDAAASKPLWQPLFEELRRRLRKRGMENIAVLGLLHDTWATKQEVLFFQDITGGMPWAMQSHGGPAEGKLLYDVAPIGYQAVVWDVRFSDDGANAHGRGKGILDSFHGWNRKVLWSQFDRWSRESDPCTRWRHQAEVCITGAQRGPGRLGAEYWKVIKDKKGKRTARAYERYPESDWRNLVIPEAIMAPGPRGAVATSQMEALREGVQECEAIIVIEQSLMDEGLKAKLGPDLVHRCEQYLHARHMMLWLSLSNLQFYHTRPGSKNGWETTCLARNWRDHPNVTGHNWFLSSGYQERTAELFALAGEVERRLGRGT